MPEHHLLLGHHDKAVLVPRGVDGVILGSAQDAGVPQLGCSCNNCTRARKGVRRTASCLAIQSAAGWIVLDATPDIIVQLDQLNGPIAAICLTHCHAGHVSGLASLGKEGPQLTCELVATPATFDYIDSNQILQAGAKQMNRVTLSAGETTCIGGLEITFHHLDHRAEYSDTVAIEVSGNHRVLYAPDTDAWDVNLDQATSNLAAGDAAFLDATFWSSEEVGHRDITEIPHPFIGKCLPQIARLAIRGINVYLTHLNHTNPLCGPGVEADAVTEIGAKIAVDGQLISLGK